MTNPSQNIQDLLAIMARLREPERGCPWDLRQDFATIAPYTIEEAYEVADAIERDDMAALKDELGDLLLQVVYHAQMASERGSFSFADIVAAICGKMIRRHPHVFGAARVADAQAQTDAWEAHKESERRSTTAGGTLDGVARSLPALTRALKLQRRAARVGFDWTEPAPVFAKIEEEIAELRLAAAAPERTAERIEDELGDLLFACVNLARHFDVDPDAALRRTNAKFERRFRWIEAALGRSGRTPSQSTLAEMDRLWDEAKRAERGG